MKDLHNVWPHRWIHPEAEVRRSVIEGLGVFAKSRIVAGSEIGVLGGIIVPADQIEKFRCRMTQVGIQISDNFFIVPSNRQELEERGVFNHSCAPNAGFSNSITLVAIRTIQPDEELTFDYAFCETRFSGFDCLCRSASCRKKIRPTDWMRPDIQKLYAPFFSPYLREKLARNLA